MLQGITPKHPNCKRFDDFWDGSPPTPPIPVDMVNMRYLAKKKNLLVT